MDGRRGIWRVRPLLALSLLVSLSLASTAPAQTNSVVADCTDNGLDTALAGGGLITFNCNYSHAPATIFFNLPKTIGLNTSIDGSNGGHTVIIDSVDNTRLFSVTTGVQLTLLNLILENGFDSDGGCLYANGALALNNVEATNCQAATGTRGGALFVSPTGSASLVNANLHDNAAASGGGVYSLGELSLSNSYFAHNVVTPTDGGGIWAIGTTVIDGSTFYSNTAANGYGGGIYNQGRLRVTNSLLNDNHADQGGGGIQTYQGATDLLNVTASGNSALQGGGLLIGQEVVTLTSVTLSGNSATFGGGINISSGAATLTNATLSGNSAKVEGGGLYNYQGAATLANVILSGNVVTNSQSQSTYGGGISNYGPLTLTQVTLSGNIATNNLNASSFGGGIYNNHYTGQGTASLTGVTLNHNSAYAGGGILNAGTLTLTNTTLSANSAASTGGGLENYEGTALLTNVTLSGNSATFGGGLYQYSFAPTQTITAQDTLIANGPSGANCYDAPTSSGVITSTDYNLSSDGTCAPEFNRFHDVNGQSPNLGPLANNGGPTLTHLPFTPSPAIDAIPLGANGCGTTLTTDQRGAPRPISGKCDIGAVEYGWVYPQLWLALIRR